MKTTGYLIILIAVLLALTIMGAQYIHESDNRIQGLQSALNERNAQIEYHTNAQGKLIAEKQAADIRLNEFKQSYPKLASELSKQFDIKLKNLQAVIHTEFEARGRGNSVINNYYDSAGNDITKLEADDGYLKFSATVYDSINAPYEYTYRDSILYAFHTKKKWLLGRKTLYASGMLSNPQAHITNTTSVRINEVKDRRWGVGPYIGYGIAADGMMQTNIGISIHYSLIKF